MQLYRVVPVTKRGEYVSLTVALYHIYTVWYFLYYPFKTGSVFTYCSSWYFILFLYN